MMKMSTNKNVANASITAASNKYDATPADPSFMYKLPPLSVIIQDKKLPRKPPLNYAII
jgi:hypothetical protein